MIPALCDYVIFSENGEKIGGDLSEQYEQIAWNVAKYGNASGKYFYKVIVRENEYVVLQYRLTPQYHSAFLCVGWICFTIFAAWNRYYVK